MSSECQHYRHNLVVLTTGCGTKDGLFCLKGEVRVCTVCKECLEGEPGSEYLNGRSLITVNQYGTPVYTHTVTSEKRQRLVRQARSSRRSVLRPPTPAWSAGD